MKREAMNTEKWLAFGESGMAESVDFLNAWISHCEATDGNLVAMNHEMAAGSAMAPVIGVRVAKVELSLIHI